jgi:hypothetical protein
MSPLEKCAYRVFQEQAQVEPGLVPDRLAAFFVARE